MVKYDRGDTAPIIQSINRAVKILRGRGIHIDLEKEMPWSGAPDYWIALRHLHDDLWARVRATEAKKPATNTASVVLAVLAGLGLAVVVGKRRQGA